jgi:hypothetical protein
LLGLGLLLLLLRLGRLGLSGHGLLGLGSRLFSGLRSRLLFRNCWLFLRGPLRFRFLRRD